ncbi:hypothetical protein WA026_009649 [Henosepilachna vigintioctopunctata]|uniref:Uncharacterized protein n=1 Tax=Henosepilachna vigintioctopunctata TaxID=420089 RepID=A0AAW1TWA5_9CUCU
MLLKTILFFLAVKTSVITEGSIRSASNVKPSSSKRGSAFNQGILKFQQLLDLPINETSNTHVTFINFDDKGGSEILNITDPNKSLPEILNITEEIKTSPEKADIPEKPKSIHVKSKCGGGNYTEKSQPENSPKLSEKKFIEDFENSNETSVETETLNKNLELKKINKNEEISKDNFNKTLEVEFVPPPDNEKNNITYDFKNVTKDSLETLDDYDEKKITKSARGRVVEIKSQTVEEIPLRSNHRNKASRQSKQQEDDDISQAIKRDILLGNLNPFFTNPSTSSIRNTNTLFFDDVITTPKSSSLITAMNPFILNSVALDNSSPSTFSRSKFSRLRTKSSKSFRKAAVETVPSLSVNEGQKFSKPFGDVGFSRSSHQTATVQNIPALLISQEDRKPKFSSKYRSGSRPSSSSAVSSVSFNISPSVHKSRTSNTRGRTKSTQSYNRPRTSSVTTLKASIPSRPALPPSKISPSSSNVVEVLKSVEYSLPEEVGKSLTKTGPSKFKRKAGFQIKQNLNIT